MHLEHFKSILMHCYSATNAIAVKGISFALLGCDLILIPLIPLGQCRGTGKEGQELCKKQVEQPVAH